MLAAPFLYLQTVPLVLRMEINDLSTSLASDLVAAMTPLMEDFDFVYYHHNDLCHIGPQNFFPNHDEYLDDMELCLSTPGATGVIFGACPARDTAQAMPFGRLPWYDAWLPVPEAWQSFTTYATDFATEYQQCDVYNARACNPEPYFLVLFSDPVMVDTFPCNPDNASTWCATAHDVDCDVDEDGDGTVDTTSNIGNTVDACASPTEVPDRCPFALPEEFEGESMCDLTSDVFYEHLLNWHGDVHERIGGAHGQDPTTSSNPLFWALHTTINDIYLNSIGCQ